MTQQSAGRDPVDVSPARERLFNEVDERFGRNVARFVDARITAIEQEAMLRQLERQQHAEQESAATERRRVVERIGEEINHHELDYEDDGYVLIGRERLRAILVGDEVTTP